MVDIRIGAAVGVGVVDILDMVIHGGHGKIHGGKFYLFVVAQKKATTLIKGCKVVLKAVCIHADTICDLCVGSCQNNRLKCSKVC